MSNDSLLHGLRPIANLHLQSVAYLSVIQLLSNVILGHFMYTFYYEEVNEF
jgi:hypothetical protein